MLITPQEYERQRQARIKEQMRDVEYRRLTGPDRDRALEDVWVAHVWAADCDTPDKGEWLFAGFRRRRHKRKPQTMGRFFGKVRRQLLIDKRASVMITDLDMATRRLASTDQHWRYRPPQFQQRKHTMEQVTPAIDRTKRKTRATVRAPLLQKKTTRYIVLGRMGFNKVLPDGSTFVAWDRRPGYLYLGPLVSTVKRDAEREARKLFGIYKELIVVPVEQLSTPMRDAMVRSKRVRAGVTRIQWPEVPPTFDAMWAKFVKRLIAREFFGLIARDDLRLVDLEVALRSAWDEQKNPWLSIQWFRQQIKPWSDACAPKRRHVKRTKSRNRAKIVSTSRVMVAPKRAKRRGPALVALGKRVVNAVLQRQRIVRATLTRQR